MGMGIIFMMVFRFCVWMPIVLTIKAFMYVIGHIIKVFTGKTQQFLNNRTKEEESWNVEGLSYVAGFILYSVIALFTMGSIYQNHEKTFLLAVLMWIFKFSLVVISFVILAAVFQKRHFISEMPALRKGSPLFIAKIHDGKKTTEKPIIYLHRYRTWIITVIPTIAVYMAFSYMMMFFLYSSFPTLALVMMAIWFLVCLAWVTIDLLGYSKKEVYQMIKKEDVEVPVLADSAEYAHIEEPVLREMVAEQTEKGNADMMIIESAPLKKKPLTEIVTMPENSRLQHMQLLGPTGVGKSVLLLNMITQDITNLSVGVCVVEPFADLAYKSAIIAEKIGRKYYYINPEYEHTHSFNPLDAWDDGDIERVAAANEEAFLASLGRETPQFYKDTQSKLLNISIKALKYAKGNETTYKDLNDLLTPSNSGFRVKIINKLEKTLDKNHVILQGIREYHMNLADDKKSAQVMQHYSGLHTYLFKLVNHSKMSRLLCRPSTFSIRDAFDKGEIILMSTGFHVLDRELSSTLGRLMVVLLKNEAFRRQEVEENERAKLPLIALYVDEFQNYIFESVKDVQTMARKTRFSMCIAHQDLAQLRAYNPDFAKIIYNNARQKIVYGGIDFDDCEFIAKQMGTEVRTKYSVSTDKWNPFEIRNSLSEEAVEKLTGADIYNLPAFNPVKFTPGKVLCKFVINNEQEIFDNGENDKASFFIGLVKPMFPMDFFKADGSVVVNAKTLNINGVAEQVEQGKPTESTQKEKVAIETQTDKNDVQLIKDEYYPKEEKENKDTKNIIDDELFDELFD